MSFDRKAFDRLVKSWKLKHFKPAELLTKVGNRRGTAINQPPPEGMWANMEKTAKLVDELRRRLGVPIVISSAYRSHSYNRAVGGARASQHVQFRALDISSPARGVGPAKIFAELQKMRAEGLFKGGLGKYSTFVHIDTRGYNATWRG